MNKTQQPHHRHLTKYALTCVLLLLSLACNSALAATATASTWHPSYPPSNVLDGDINTRWAGYGSGATLTVDLGSTKAISAVKLAFYKGDQRITTFDVQLSTNNSSWTTVLSSAKSSGSTKWNQTFSFSERSARYVRLVGYTSNVNNWTDITKFSVVSGGGSGDCDKPSDVLDLTNWKITVPYTSATGSTDGNTNKAAEVKQPALDSYERSPEFTNSGCDYVQFRAHAGGATTSGSGYPRSELREMTSNGSSNASWSSTSGTHEMEVVLSVSKLPTVKPHLVVAQIHDGGDDVITFRLEGTKFVMEIDGSDGPTLDSNYALNEKVTLKWVVSGGVTKSYFNGQLVHTLNQNYSGAYFKAGAYTQSACSGDKKVSGESCSAYGETKIYALKVTHK